MGIRIEVKPVVVGLPGAAYVEYCGSLKDGTEFIIHRPQENWDYSNWTCLLKQVGWSHFVPEPIDQVIRYRDGGTTMVRIAAGEFRFPTPFDPAGVATFGGEEIPVHNRQEGTALCASRG